MKTLKQLLAGKTQSLAAVSPKDTVFHALQVMADNKVGAVLVLDGEQLVGIFSERDYARKVVLLGRSSADTRVGQIMSSPVRTVASDATVQYCMELMTEHRIRHLPVVDSGQLVGMISIGDCVRAVIEDQAETIRHLERFISS